MAMTMAVFVSMPLTLITTALSIPIILTAGPLPISLLIVTLNTARSGLLLWYRESLVKCAIYAGKLSARSLDYRCL